MSWVAIAQGFRTWSHHLEFQKERQDSVLTVAHESNASSASTCTATACGSSMKEKILIAGVACVSGGNKTTHHNDVGKLRVVIQ